MIILEGPNYSGKSFLAEVISKKFHLPVIHRSGPCSRRELFDRMEKVLVYDSPIAIHDRIPCISEQIYGPILRDTNHFDGTIFLDLLLNREPLILYCKSDIIPPLDLVDRDKEKSGKDESHTRETISSRKDILAKYDQFMGAIPHVKYDWAIASDPRYMNIVLDFIGLILKDRW